MLFRPFGSPMAGATRLRVCLVRLAALRSLARGRALTSAPIDQLRHPVQNALEPEAQHVLRVDAGLVGLARGLTDTPGDRELWSATHQAQQHWLGLLPP